MEAMEYTVILHWDEEYSGYWVEVQPYPAVSPKVKTKRRH